MPSGSRETSQERESGDDNKESSEETAISSPDTSKMDETSPVFYSDCTGRCTSPDLYPPEVEKGIADVQLCHLRHYMKRNRPKPMKRFSDENGAILNDESKMCSEKPLDFSKKASFKKVESSSTITSQKYQENGEDTSDGADDSCNEEKHTPFAGYSPADRTRQRRAVFHMNGSENAVESEKDLSNMNMINAHYYRMKEFEKNGYHKAANSSGSEDEFHPDYLKSINKSFELNGNHSRPESSYSPYKWERNPSLQLERPHVSKSPSENGFSSSKLKKGFHMQDLLSQCHQPPKERPGHQFFNFMTQQRTSPQPSVSHLGKEKNLLPKSISPYDAENVPSGSSSPSYAMNLPSASNSPSYGMNLPSASNSPSHAMNLPAGYTSSNHYMPLPPERFPYGAMGGFPESNAILYPGVPRAFPPSQMANLMHKGFPGEMSDYSRPYPHPPGSMLQAKFNAMYERSYLLAGQNHQMPKKTRPFKEIDPALIMQQLQAQLPASLNFDTSPPAAYSSSTAECNGSRAANSSPPCPDSQTNVIGSSSNESQQQDTNETRGRKKARKTPPEKQDPKYLERRRKNNIAAKKSRDVRREKEDQMARAVGQLMSLNVRWETRYEALCADYKCKENKLEMIIATLVSFREKCDGQSKKLFDETFKPFLPLPLR